MRGGGGNFGVVTEFEVNLHPLTSVVLAEGLTPEADIRRLLECWRDFMAEAPFDLKWNIDLRLAPHTKRSTRRASRTASGQQFFEFGLAIPKPDVHIWIVHFPCAIRIP